MSRNKGIISDKLREEIAKELGVFDQVNPVIPTIILFNSAG